MIISLDLETTGLDWQRDSILLIGYRIDRKGEVVYASTDTKDSQLASYLSDPDTTLSGHNIVFDALFLAKVGYEINCQLEDTKVLAYCCWPTLESHSLKDLVEIKLKKKVTRLDDVLFKPLKRELTYLEDIQDQYYIIAGKWGRKDLIREYHKQDVLNIDRLRSIMVATPWFNQVEKPLTRLLFDMQLYGVCLNPIHLGNLNNEYTQRATSLASTFGTGINPNSRFDVADHLKKLGYDLSKLSKKTKDGSYSVSKDVLKRLSWRGESFAKNLLDYRKTTKILSTYVHPLTCGSTLDGKIHGTFNQAGSEDIYGEGKRGTKTGRLSSSQPNLQNIPARTKEGKEVRKAFIATKGMFLFDSDLAQIEPRLVAHYSQSPKLIEAYNKGLDTHRLFAIDIFGPNPTDNERFIGKSSWLATTYGCQPQKLLWICENFSDNPLELDLSKHKNAFDLIPKESKYGPSQAKLLKQHDEPTARDLCAKWSFFKQVQDNFIKKNPEIWNWRKEHIQRTKTLGYIQTIGGRIIKIPGLDSPNKWDVIEAERFAVNYQIQGSAADIMKMILVRFHTDKEFKGRVLTTVHDEVLGELYDEKDIDIVKKFMEMTVSLNKVPICSDTKLITNWGDK